MAFARQPIEQSQCHHLARLQTRLTMFWQVPNLVIHPTEQFRDKIDCGHENSSSLMAWSL
jgi:hypothetical protein